MKWFKRIGIALLIVLVLVLLAALWLLNTGAGARFVLARAEAALDGKLIVERSSGTLAGPLRLEGLRYRDAEAGVDARVGTLSVDLALTALLGRRVVVQDLAVEAVDVALTTLPPKPEEPAGTFSLQPPLDIALERFALRGAKISQDGQPLFAADSLDLAAAWTGAGITVRQLALRAPDGSVDLDGTLTTREGYAGKGRTTFRWRAGDAEYAGTLDADSDGKQARLALRLDTPMAATLDATLGQDARWPWTLALDVPRFDPKVLAPEAGLAGVAVALRGEGDRGQGSLAGDVTLDERRLHIEPLRYALTDELLRIEALGITSPDFEGRLDANGEVRLKADPVSATLTLDWKDVVLPAELAGQVLASHGRLDVEGSAAAYAARGSLSVGPPGQLADITLDLDGTPEAVALKTLALVQPKGGLDASGTVTLKPAIGWDIRAKAQRLDPGAFAADWPGALDFDLASTGTLTDQGPDTTLRIDRLGGTLRQRPVGGQADLTIKPDFIVDGNLTLRSGGSTVEMTGRGGNQTDASLRLAIASLADWLPDAGGRLGGDFRIRGRWPALNVDGRADGTAIAFGDLHIDTLGVTANVANLEDPSGKATVTVAGLTQGDLRFDSLAVEAEGNQTSHRLRLAGAGKPADITLALSGGAKDGRWNGSLGTLGLSIAGPRETTRFDLAAPAAMGWDGQRFTLADSCLTGADARLCVGGNGAADGSLAARYRIEKLPLRTVVRLAAPDAPVRLRGEINGEGDIRRDAAGALNGQATLTSAEGSVIYVEAGAQPLLSYTGFALDARFSPSATVATVKAGLDHDGRLDGRVELGGAPGSDQNLGGRVTLDLKSLAFLELLTTEVANTKGSLAADYTLGGTLSAPQLAGALTLKDFATEVPIAGLKLHDGQVTLRAEGADRFVLQGGIGSGKGRLTIDGNGGLAAAAPLAITIRGEDFLAADIPAANVLISPDLSIERNASGTYVNGKVAVPKANVDVSKLPGGGASAASPDVVVTDAERVEPGQAPPVVVNVSVELGDQVKLAGFGLDGTIAGNLRINQRPGRAPTGTGTLNVGGTYKAYGQDLKIETGRVLFAGTALDNPGLDIRAVRKIEADDVTAGLMVRGTAILPVLTVFSEPAMEQSQALSYLVTGKPLSALGSGEGDMLGTAARALGTAGGDLLAKSIGKRMGVDDIGVADNAALGGAAFTVGKYLSPKLYLSYGVGIFEPGEVVTLRYLFHRRWNFEAQSATNGNRAGINYRYEK